MLDERRAAEAVAGMEDGARSHIRHRLRNAMQAILAEAEAGTPEGVGREVMRMSEEMRRLGL